MYLVDTNVWLERLLDQKHSAEVGSFLHRTPSDRLYMTDFALHSVGIVLARLDHLDTFKHFIQDVFIEGAVNLVRLSPEDMMELVNVMQRFSLDFDDAYQYVAAAGHGLVLVSFDADFDRTEMGRRTPAQAL